MIGVPPGAIFLTSVQGAVTQGVVALVVLAVFSVGAVLGRPVIRRLALRLPVLVVSLLTRAFFGTLIVLGLLLFLSILFGNGNVAITGVVAASVVASFGVQDLLRNYVSGLYLLLERNIRVGDSIHFDTGEGVVEEIRVRVSYLRGKGGELVVVPNTELFNKVVSVRPRGRVRAMPPGPGAPLPSGR